MTIKRGVRFLIVGILAAVVALVLAAFESPEVRSVATYAWLVAVVCGVVFLVHAAVAAWRWTSRKP